MERLHPWFVVLAVFASSCGEEALRDWSASTRQPIFGGAPTSGDPAVWSLVTDDADAMFYCTATLISDEYVLTAAHCVMDNANRPNIIPGEFFICPDRAADGQRSECWVAPVATDPSNGGRPFVHPGYDGKDAGMAFDLAVIKVGPSGVAPKALPAGPLPQAAIGDDARIVGYGYIDNFVTPDARYAGRTQITHLGPMAQGTTGDNPFGLSEFTFQNAGYPNTCMGDSGGPLFWPPDAVGEALVGTVSWGDEGCDVFGVNVNVGSHLCWLEGLGVPTAVCPGNPEPELCHNGIDDDLDGIVDCADDSCQSDPDCQTGLACQGAPTIRCGEKLASSTVGGTTSLAEYSCAPSDAWNKAERSWLIEAPEGTTVRATMWPDPGIDLDLLVLGSAKGLCAPGLCVGASIDPDDSIEQVEFVVPAEGAYVVVESWDVQGAFEVEVTCAGVQELCGNGLDDDSDGATDCADSACASEPACAVRVELCDNGLDDDGNGDLDCADAACASEPACASDLEDCGNGIDDDGDGDLDCADSGCGADPACAPVEVCDNAVDDDGDGRIDCADTDCAGATRCAGGGGGGEDEKSGFFGCSAAGGSATGGAGLLIGLLFALGLGRGRRNV